MRIVNHSAKQLGGNKPVFGQKKRKNWLGKLLLMTVPLVGTGCSESPIIPRDQGVLLEHSKRVTTNKKMAKKFQFTVERRGNDWFAVGKGLPKPARIVALSGAVKFERGRISDYRDYLGLAVDDKQETQRLYQHLAQNGAHGQQFLAYDAKYIEIKGEGPMLAMRAGKYPIWNTEHNPYLVNKGLKLKPIANEPVEPFNKTFEMTPVTLDTWGFVKPAPKSWQNGQDVILAVGSPKKGVNVEETRLLYRRLKKDFLGKYVFRLNNAVKTRMMLPGKVKHPVVLVSGAKDVNLFQRNVVTKLSSIKDGSEPHLYSCIPDTKDGKVPKKLDLYFRPHDKASRLLEAKLLNLIGQGELLKDVVITGPVRMNLEFAKEGYERGTLYPTTIELKK